jgi:serine/threonine protein kinase
MASYSGPDHLAALAPGTKITASHETSGYETSGEKLGHGTFGVVYPATHVSDQQQVALKILYPDSHDGTGNEWQEEIHNLDKAGRLPSSVNIIRLVEAFVWEREGQKHFCLATAPICEGGNLEKLLLERPDSYRLASALRWSLQVISHTNTAVESDQPQYENIAHYLYACVLAGGRGAACLAHHIGGGAVPR